MTTIPRPSAPTDILINFVLDKSGSMGSLQGPTIEGVNAFIAGQRQGQGRALMSLTLFDTSFDVRFVGLDIREVPALGSRENRYQPQGGTALYDAVVTTIRGAEAWLANHPDFAGDVVTVIQTDGEENSSTIASLDDVNALITEKTALGWEFIFQGTGQSAWTEAAKFTAIPAASRFAGSSDEAAYAQTYAASSRAMMSKRATGAPYAAALRDEGMPDALSE